MKNTGYIQKPLSSPLLWSLFIVYVIIAAVTIAHHEMWGDEIHSWNIAKASAGYLDLLYNIRFEGHPPVWYTILWAISKCTHNTAYVQAVHGIIACGSVFLLLFFSRIPLFCRALIPFGYFFLYEFSVLSRNYSVGVLLTLSICYLIHRNFRYKFILYYTLLFLMTNTHLLAMLLAGSLHLYFLTYQYEQKKGAGSVITHILCGLLIALPSLYFMFPPADSQLNTQYWFNRWDYHNLTAFIQAPLRSFVPVPAWWNPSFWHTQFLVELKEEYLLFKIINLLVATVVVLLAVFVLRTNKKSLLLFSVNFLLSFIVAVLVFPMTSARYAGFIFIGFIAAFWLFCNETPVTAKNRRIVIVLLLIQLCGAMFSVITDIQRPFSNAFRVKELINEAPPGERVVTDYWALNVVATFTDKEMYCVDLEKEKSFVQWDSDMGAMMKKQYRYYAGIRDLFQKEKIHTAYMISTGSPETLQRVDPQFFRSFRVKLADKREGAIEKGGNLYLYEITGD